MKQKKDKDVFQEALDFEALSIVMVEKSERRAWNITKASCALTVISLIAIMLIMPLKTIEPYLIKVNENTGYTEMLTTIGTQQEPQNVAVDKFWIANYVRYREHYDWHTLQHDYNNTLLLSSPKVASTYAGLFEGKNALDKRWGKKVEARIKILNIIPDLETNIATVRFSKTIQSVDETKPAKPVVWIATLGYTYDTSKPLTMDQRLKNPLAFTITSYRVDAELSR